MAALLQQLTAAGLRLSVNADKIIVAPRDKLTENLREIIRAHRSELLQELSRSGPSGNPLMTRGQAEDCHAGVWDDAEIAAYTGRVLRFVRRGIATDSADNIAERLTLRDREHDDR